MVKKIIYSFLILSMVLVAAYIFQPIKRGKGSDQTTNYVRLKNWPKLPDSLLLGNPVGIGIDTNQNIVVFQRAGREWPLFASMPEKTIQSNTVLIIDKENGKLVESWGNNQFIMPHGLTVDRQNNIWVTDEFLAGFCYHTTEFY